jgi:hypothetical protein
MRRDALASGQAGACKAHDKNISTWILLFLQKNVYRIYVIMQNLNDFEDFEKNINQLLLSGYKEAISNEELMKLLEKIKENKLTRISNKELKLFRDFEECYQSIATCISTVYS